MALCILGNKHGNCHVSLVEIVKCFSGNCSFFCVRNVGAVWCHLAQVYTVSAFTKPTMDILLALTSRNSSFGPNRLPSSDPQALEQAGTESFCMKHFACGGFVPEGFQEDLFHPSNTVHARIHVTTNHSLNDTAPGGSAMHAGKSVLPPPQAPSPQPSSHPSPKFPLPLTGSAQDATQWSAAIGRPCTLGTMNFCRYFSLMWNFKQQTGSFSSLWLNLTSSLLQIPELLFINN